MRFRAVGRLLGLGPITLCALSAHATLYRPVFPEDGIHGYFGWYEPLVAALWLASAFAVAAAAIALLRGHRSRVMSELASLRPTPFSAGSLAVLGVAWLLAQESAERSLASAGFAFADFTPADWAIVVATTMLAAAVLTMLAGAGRVLASALGSRAPQPTRPTVTKSARRKVGSYVHTRRALADRRGLRAPPISA
jgi:hypothetical protein